jgi:DNA-binding response OmpR family regulator
VDDEPKNLQVLGTILKKRNHNVAVATNGFQALDMAVKRSPDLILLDVMMPDIDGYETCRKLKENKETRDIPVIFLTAKYQVEDIIKGFEAGAVDYVTKPFNTAELLARIKTHVELKRAREEIKTLRGIIPICCNCKKIRDDEGYWQQVDAYVHEHTEARFSHGICPDCMKELYPWYRPKDGN